MEQKKDCWKEAVLLLILTGWIRRLSATGTRQRSLIVRVVPPPCLNFEFGWTALTRRCAVFRTPIVCFSFSRAAALSSLAGVISISRLNAAH